MAQATDPDIETQDAAHHHKAVEVFLEITNEEGDTQTRTLEIPRGETEVAVLKTELGVRAEASLWVIRKNGKKKQLANHEKHDVKEGDRYQTVIPGGVS